MVYVGMRLYCDNIGDGSRADKNIELNDTVNLIQLKPTKRGYFVWIVVTSTAMTLVTLIVSYMYTYVSAQHTVIVLPIVYAVVSHLVQGNPHQDRHDTAVTNIGPSNRLKRYTGICIFVIGLMVYVLNVDSIRMTVGVFWYLSVCLVVCGFCDVYAYGIRRLLVASSSGVSDDLDHDHEKLDMLHNTHFYRTFRTVTLGSLLISCGIATLMYVVYGTTSSGTSRYIRYQSMRPDGLGIMILFGIIQSAWWITYTNRARHIRHAIIGGGRLDWVTCLTVMGMMKIVTGVVSMLAFRGLSDHWTNMSVWMYACLSYYIGVLAVADRSGRENSGRDGSKMMEWINRLKFGKRNMVRYVVSVIVSIYVVWITIYTISFNQSMPITTPTAPSYKTMVTNTSILPGFFDTHQCYVDPVMMMNVTMGLTGATILDAIETECQHATPSALSRCSVPNIVHVVMMKHPDRNNTMKFEFHHYVAIMSMMRYVTPDFLFIHGNGVPIYNEYLQRILKLPNVRMVETRIVDTVHGIPVTVTEHVSDVVRLETMIRFGGMYFDLDVFVMDKMTPYMQTDAVMGEQVGRGINSGMLIGKRCARMYRKWYTGYKTFRDDVWDLHAIVLPKQVVVGDRGIVRLDGDALKNTVPVEYMFDEEYDLRKWKGVRAVHSFYRHYGKQHDDEDVKSLMNNYGRFVRNVLYDGPRLGEPMP